MRSLCLAKVGGGLPVRASSAETLLGIIAASMLTFVGVVFSITLVALQLASAQLSPRVIRTFVRSGVTRLAFGLFLATFGYAIVVIVVEGAASSPDVLRLAATLGVLLVLASLAVFVVYVAATMRLLQVSWVVTAVADETRRALSADRPVAASYLSVAAPVVDLDPRVVRLKGEQDDRSGEFGVILGIDRGRLVQLGQRYDCLLQLLPKVGSISRLALPWWRSTVGTARLTTPYAAVFTSVGHARCTRIRCTGSANSWMLPARPCHRRSTSRPQPLSSSTVWRSCCFGSADAHSRRALFVDTAGVVRLMHPEPTWAETVDLAFTEIAIYGASSPAVTRRLVAAYESLRQSVPVDLRLDIARHLALLGVSCQCRDSAGASNGHPPSRSTRTWLTTSPPEGGQIRGLLGVRSASSRSGRGRSRKVVVV